MAKDTDYLEEAMSDAWETMEEYVDEMVEMWKNDEPVSNDLNNDYGSGDSYHHETHVDRAYRLKDAVDLLEQLSQYEEDDHGLWQGQQPRTAISTQAAYTYSNAVYAMWSGLVDDLNGYLDSFREDMQGADEPASDEQVEAAGERLIRLYVLLADRDGSEFEGLVSAAWGGVQVGDRTAALVLADKVQETGNESLAKSIREAVSAEADEPDEEEEAA